MPDGGIYSVGHSTHPIDVFIGLLAEHGINVVADVRSTPFSRFNPQFNRDDLSEALAGRGIGYEFFGGELGGRSSDPGCYDEEGRIIYGRVQEKDRFKAGIKRLVEGAADARVALVCSEKEPLDCHRTLLVAEALAEAGHEVRHIYADGTVRSHTDVVDGLVNGRQQDLFGAPSRDEVLSRRAQEVAYRRPVGPTGSVVGREAVE